MDNSDMAHTLKWDAAFLFLTACTLLGSGRPATAIAVFAWSMFKSYQVISCVEKHNG